MDKREMLRLTGDPPKSRRRILTPTLIARADRCLHSWTLECFADPKMKVEADAGTRMLWDRGKRFEQEMVATLPKVQEPAWDGKNWAEGFRATLDLMRQGVEWIYQGVLLGGTIAGQPDLLHRTQGRTILGAFDYAPVDIKSHKGVTRKDRLQLAGYARLLERLLGKRPSSGGIWLGTREIEIVPLDPLMEEFEKLTHSMSDLRNRSQDATCGYRCSECRLCPWIGVCQREWEIRRCVCLVYGVTSELARRFSQLGWTSYDRLSQVGVSQLVGEAKLKAKVAQDIDLHARARAQGTPIIRQPFVMQHEFPVVYYDVESFGDSVYLHGIVTLDRDHREERQFCAKTPFDEGLVWREFLDYLALRKPERIYTWTNFERGYTQNLWAQHGGNPRGWEVLESRMVDLCALTKQHLALPVYSYSIKDVAPLFGFQWRAKDAGGLNSEAWYREWLEKEDVGMLQKILDYNMDDVLAMEVIHQEIRRVMNQCAGC